MKKCAIIPAYNEEKTIRQIVQKTSNYVDEVIMVDDGSTDNTLEEIVNLNANIIKHEKNKGKGVALKTGFKYALGKNYDVILTLDADGQHLPEEIPLLLQKIEEYDIIIGKRKRDRKMPLIRKIANSLSSAILSYLTKQKITDSQSGFRAIKNSVIKDIKLETKNYDIETEFLLRAAEKGYKIGEVEISTIYGSKSKINPFLQLYRFFSLVTKEIFKKQK